METLTTHGIKISVETHYQQSHSEPLRNRYLHVYNIRIENLNPFPVRLLRRHWIIIEGTGLQKEVEGKGVIGKQPLIHPRQFHAYSSYTIMHTDIGMMEGSYLMLRSDTNERFQVRIPKFVLVPPQKLN